MWFITLLRQKFLEFVSESRQHLFPVANNTKIGIVKDTCLRVFIYGDDTFGLGAATQMLDGTRKSYGNIKIGAHNFSGNPYHERGDVDSESNLKKTVSSCPFIDVKGVIKGVKSTFDSCCMYMGHSLTINYILVKWGRTKLSN